MLVAILSTLFFAVGLFLGWLRLRRAKSLLAEAKQQLETALASSMDLQEEVASWMAKHGQSQAEADAGRTRLSELERRLYESESWQGKFESLLKENQAITARVSELEKTKVELRFCQQQLDAARKKIGDLEVAG